MGTADAYGFFESLHVIDVSAPASPAIMGSVDMPSAVSGVAVSGSYAYVADGSSGLQVVDVSTLPRPLTEIPQL